MTKKGPRTKDQGPRPKTMDPTPTTVTRVSTSALFFLYDAPEGLGVAIIDPAQKVVFLDALLPNRLPSLMKTYHNPMVLLLLSSVDHESIVDFSRFEHASCGVSIDHDSRPNEEGPLDALRRIVTTRYDPNPVFCPLPHDETEEWTQWIDWNAPLVAA